MSEKFKHTPGPWEWEIQDYSMVILHGEDVFENLVMSVGPCNSCCKDLKKTENPVFKFGRCMTPSEPDAQLIATAPEMLEALKLFMIFNCASFEKCFDKDYKCMVGKNDCRYIITANIIEKATGLKIEEILK